MIKYKKKPLESYDFFKIFISLTYNCNVEKNNELYF